MNNKKDIVDNWLPRYTGTALNDFGDYILLTNFHHYVKLFSEWNNVPINGLDKPMPNATCNGITIINFGIGSPNAALIMDLLSAINPKAALFLGKCGGLKKKNAVGDLILPIAAIRGEGTSNDYFPPEVLSKTRRLHRRQWTGNSRRRRAEWKTIRARSLHLRYCFSTSWSGVA